LVEKLKLARKTAGLTQFQLAGAAGISMATLQNIEAGKANPEWSTLERLFAALSLEFTLKPKDLDYERLRSIGVPLIGMESKQQSAFIKAPKLSSSIVIDTLKANMAQILNLSESSREFKAMLSYLWAIKDHYPKVFLQLGTGPKSWVERGLESTQPIALRRIVLSYLGEHL